MTAPGDTPRVPPRLAPTTARERARLELAGIAETADTASRKADDALAAVARLTDIVSRLQATLPPVIPPRGATQ